MDKLKQYLREQREAMDTDQPSEPVLSAILAASPVIKKISTRILVFRYAAAFIGLAALAIGIRLLRPEPAVKNVDELAFARPSFPARKKVQDPNSLVVDANQPITDKIKVRNKYTRIDPYELLGSFSNNYSQLVRLQLKSIRSTPVWAEDPGYFSDFKSTLEQMDTDEAALRQAIKRNGLNEHLLEQVINIYQQKLDLLKTLKSEIGKINKTVKPGNTDSLKSYFVNI